MAWTLGDDRAYVAAKIGLYVLDISDPTDPVVLDEYGNAIGPPSAASFEYPDDFLPSKGGWVVVRDNLAYVTSFKNGATEGGIAIYKLYEIDADGDGIDGITDEEDECADTPAGEAVDETGCSVFQHCPCETWKWKFLARRCVRWTAWRFLRAELIDVQEFRDLVRASIRHCR